MKKLKTYIIHLLGGMTHEECVQIIHLRGGVTREDCVQHNVAHYDLGCRNTARMFKRFADQMNGMPADDWCKLMYNHICGYIKRLEEQSCADAPGASDKTESYD